MASTPSSGFSPAVPLPSADRDDLISIAAIGVLAFIAADIAHEVAGHGIGLLIAGADPVS